MTTTDRPPCECGRVDRFPTDRHFDEAESSRGEFRSRRSDDWGHVSGSTDRVVRKSGVVVKPVNHRHEAGGALRSDELRPKGCV